MYKLENNNEKDMFQAIVDDITETEAWNIMNDVKKVPVVPGICMTSIIQIAEYFEVPLQLIKKFFRGTGSGSYPYNRYPFEGKCAGLVELSEFALSKRRVKWNGLNYWELQFRDFKMVAPNAGLQMVNPYKLLDFIASLQDESPVAREIAMEIIRKFKPHKTFGDAYPIYGYEYKIKKMAHPEVLKEKFAEYEKQQSIKRELAKNSNIVMTKEEFCNAVGNVLNNAICKDAEILFDKLQEKEG